MAIELRETDGGTVQKHRFLVSEGGTTASTGLSGRFTPINPLIDSSAITRLEPLNSLSTLRR